MKKQIENLNYDVDQKILSPVDFKIPQTRDRLYIVAKQNKLDSFEWPKKYKTKPNLKRFWYQNQREIKRLTEKNKIY